MILFVSFYSSYILTFLHSYILTHTNMTKSSCSSFLYTSCALCASLSILITICIGCCVAINFAIGGNTHLNHNLHEIREQKILMQKNTIFNNVLRKDIQLDTSSCTNITSYEQFITTIECFEGNKKYCNHIHTIQCIDNFLTISTKIQIYIGHTNAINSVVSKNDKNNKCKINFNSNFLNVKIDQMCYSLHRTVYNNYLW